MQLSLDRALRALRERWWLLAVAAVLAAIAAFAYTRLPWVEPRWRSSVWIQATGRFDYGNTLALERALRPLAEQVRQLSIMREVDAGLHLDVPPEKMLAETRAEPVQDSNQIRIDVDDPDPRRAERMALEIADVYAQRHNAEQQSKLREEQVILTVLDRLSTATLIWPQTRILVPLAAALGAAVAALVVLAQAALDDTLRTPEEVETQLGLPVVGLIPVHAPHPTARVGRRLPRAAGPARAAPSPPIALPQKE